MLPLHVKCLTVSVKIADRVNVSHVTSVGVNKSVKPPPRPRSTFPSFSFLRNIGLIIILPGLTGFCEIWILRNKKKSGFYEIKKSGFCEINIFYNIYKIWILRNEKKISGFCEMNQLQPHTVCCRSVKKIWILRNEPIVNIKQR